MTFDKHNRNSVQVKFLRPLDQQRPAYLGAAGTTGEENFDENSGIDMDAGFDDNEKDFDVNQTKANLVRQSLLDNTNLK